MLISGASKFHFSGRAAIRNEKRARRETVEWWVKIIGGFITIVTGLVGALIGLISVLKHR